MSNEPDRCELCENSTKLMGSLGEIVDFSHRVPVKCVEIWSKSGSPSHSFYFWMLSVRNADSLASILMDSSLYGWTIDCVNIGTEDCSKVEFFISRKDGEYNTNITSEVVENLMRLTWEN